MKLKSLNFFSRAAAMLLVMMLTTMTGWAENVTYLDENGTEQTCSTYTTMTSTSTSLTAGWYVVNEDVTIADRITVSGTVNLILCDGATLTASKGITVGSSATFNIYAQTDDEATMGALVASGANSNVQYNAGIGGVDNTAAGTITINGGKINATGMVGAGIGSGGQSGATVGTITINGGIVTAQDGSGLGAGIGGGGIQGKAGTINLNGGVIHAAGIGSGYMGGDCSITVNISDGVKKIVATPVEGGACIGKGASASGTVTVNFKSGGNVVTGDAKDAVFYDTGEGSQRQIRAKALNHTVTMSDDLKANITLNTEYAFAGETVTLTLGTAVDATTLSVNGGAVATTDAGNRQYTFTMPDGDVTVTATLLQTYAVSLPANMEVVSATNAADADGKYITGTTVTFKASFPYAASNVSDGTSTLEPDANGIYTVTVADADITVTATVERSTTIDLTDAPGDFNAIEGDVLTGTTSHTVTIADGAGITLSGATISGGIVCEGTATITLVGTNSTTGKYGKAGIQIGGSGTTLTINGDGTLTANGGDDSAGIGLNRAWDVTEDVVGGNIVINGGNITANGGGGGAGIGAGVTKDTNNSSSRKAIVGNIAIAGGSVTAVGGSNADGIGAGQNNYNATIQIGTVTIYDAIEMVDASSIKDFASVTYMHDDTDVTASASDYFTIIENGDRRIIVPKDDTDYTITIADGIEHGTLTVAAATAKYMQTVTVTATPAFGYRFVRLIVKDAQNNDVASSGNTFQMPKGGATVSAVFEQGVHGTTEFVWGYPGPGGFVNEATIYDGVTTVNIQQTEQSYYILKNEEYTYSNFRLDNSTYDANIPYAGGTGEFYESGYPTNFVVPYDGETGYYDITMTDVGNGKWGVSILPTPAQMDVVPDQTYTGSAITPEPLVIAGSLSLTKGTDYTYSYTNNTNVGTATVRATFQGDYESLGYVERTFTIVSPPSYAINKGTVKGGDIAFFIDEACNTPVTTAVMDQKVYIKVTPDNGYELNSITAQATIASINAESRRNTPATTTIPLDGQVAVTLVDGTTDVYQLTMPPANVQVEATFTPVVYSITYDLGGGSVATANPTSYTIESDPITLVNPTLEGYTFGGWTDSNGDTPQTEVTIVTGQTGNRNYKAVWYTEATVQVAWEDMDDHDGIRPVSVTATLSDGTEVTLSSSNSWTSTVTNLPAFDIEGQAIVYTWTESEVDGYELVGSTTEDGATTLTYSHTPTVTLTIGSGGWATYYHEDGLTYSVSDGAQAYYVSGIGEGVVNLTAIDVVPSGLPVLISGSGTVTLTAGATEVEVSDNDARFKGTPTALEATDFTDFAVGRTYVLYKGVFLLADTNSGIGAHKCWLTLSGSNARQLNLNVGDATGITPTPNPSRAGGEWYTLDGRKLSGEPTRKGLHIYNGKKVIK